MEIINFKESDLVISYTVRYNQPRKILTSHFSFKRLEANSFIHGNQFFYFKYVSIEVFQDKIIKTITIKEKQMYK